MEGPSRAGTGSEEAPKVVGQGLGPWGAAALTWDPDLGPWGSFEDWVCLALRPQPVSLHRVGGHRILVLTCAVSPVSVVAGRLGCVGQT